MAGTKLDAAMDFFLPPYCVGCRRTWHDWFCDECSASLHRIQEPVCSRCGGALAQDGAICGGCIRQPVPDCLADTRSIALYRDALGRAIRALKYGRAAVLADPLGALMASYLLENPLPDPLLVPAPLHAEKLRCQSSPKGYQQSAAKGDQQK